MIGFFLKRVRGPWVLAVVVAAVGFGYWALNVAPQWFMLVAAQGGTEIQERTGASSFDVLAAVITLRTAGLADTALQFYALDLPNFTLLGAAGASLMAFGLRRFGLDASPARWLIALPLLAAFFDAVETGGLAALFLGAPDTLAQVIAPAITAKRWLASIAAPLGLALAVLGLAWWLIRLVWRPRA